jgi:hypothetical protein
MSLVLASIIAVVAAAAVMILYNRLVRPSAVRRMASWSFLAGILWALVVVMVEINYIWPSPTVPLITPYDKCMWAAFEFAHEQGGDQPHPWLTFDSHWNDTYKLCLVEMTNSMDPLKTVVLHDAFKDEDVATLWIDPEKNNPTNCSIALDVIHLFRRAALGATTTLTTASLCDENGCEPRTALPAMTCASEKEFESYVAPLMTG